jgi:transcriptional regulator of met regulon
MITNFEEITFDLTDDELKLVNPICAGLIKRTAKNPIKAPEIVKQMNIFAEQKGLVKLTDARLRKVVNYIRCNSMMPLMATKKGYYCATTKDEIASQIQSLKERASSILNAANGLEKFM